MCHLLQDGNLTQTCDRKSVSVSALDFYLIKSVKPAILLVSGFVYDAVCSHSDPLQLCEIYDTSCVADKLLSFHK